MKRIETERAAIERARNETPNKNITIAAKRLGVARRTLQNRMRDYGMPPGESGRPRELLSYRDSGFSLSTLVVVGVAFGIGYWVWKRKDQQAVVGGADGLHGLDVICGR